MTRAQFETWLRGTQLALADDGSAVLRVRTTFTRELLETRFRERIETAIRQVTGRSCALRIVVGAAGVASEEEPADNTSDDPPSAEPPQEMARGGVRRSDHPTRRAARGHADYAGPSLFAGAAAAEAGASPTTTAAVPSAPPNEASQPRARRPVPSLPARRRAGSASRGASPTGRIRAAVERAVASGPIDPAAPGDEHASNMVIAIARGKSDGHGERHELGHANRSEGAQPGSAPHRNAPNDGEKTMSEQADAYGGSGGGQLPVPRLNPRYTFATFIVGSGNQLAHAASQAVAEAPGQAYNPLFLYGPVGLGKTHLLHAIGHKALEMGLTVLYVSSETFTNEIINAIRYRTTEEFRAKYRSVDMLLVDDIQFIAGKDSTEEEFFHTFNSLYELSKQIVMCSDRPPKALVSLEERLRSRFEWGLIADIQPPDLETRVAILRAKADLMRRIVPDDVMTYLASRLQSNIRELEGSFNRLLAYAQLQGLPLSIETAKAALASISTDGRQRRVSVAEVLGAVAEYYRIPEDDLKGKQRDKHIVVPRQVAMYLMRQETEASLLEIGQALGGRDHSTVLHGCDKIAREINENSSLRKEVLAIRQQLMG